MYGLQTGFLAGRPVNNPFQSTENPSAQRWNIIACKHNCSCAAEEIGYSLKENKRKAYEMLCSLKKCSLTSKLAWVSLLEHCLVDAERVGQAITFYWILDDAACYRS
eukprot:1148205-Pelagomonas_calceolata.AAC.4